MGSICIKYWHSLQCTSEELSVLWPFLFVTWILSLYTFLPSHHTLILTQTWGPEHGRSLEGDDTSTCLSGHYAGSKSCLLQRVAFLFLFSGSQQPSVAAMHLQNNTFSTSNSPLMVIIHISISSLHLGIACMRGPIVMFQRDTDLGYRWSGLPASLPGGQSSGEWAMPVTLSGLFKVKVQRLSSH